jgi:DNA polymerase-3 subunit alpha
MSLFGDETEIINKEFPDTKEWPDRIKLEYERQAIGFYLSGHPLLEYKDIIQFSFNTTSEKDEWKDGQDVKLAGAITEVKTKRTQRGDLWATVEISDLEGTVSVLVFPNVFKEKMEQITEGNVVIIEGSVREEEESKSVIAKDIYPLNDRILGEVNNIVIKMYDEEITDEFLSALKEFIERNRSEKGKPVIIEAKLKDCFVKLQLHPDYSLPVEPEVFKELQRIIPKERITVN